MGLLKFGTIGMYEQALNNPRVVAKGDMVNGYCFKVVDNASKEEATPFTDDADAKVSDLYVMLNLVDKPEILNYADYKIVAGENLNAYKLSGLQGYYMEMSGDLIVGADAITVGKHLVPVPAGYNQMKWKDAGAVVDYKTTLEVTDITTFGTFTIDGAGRGFKVKISSN